MSSPDRRVASIVFWVSVVVTTVLMGLAFREGRPEIAVLLAVVYGVGYGFSWWTNSQRRG